MLVLMKCAYGGCTVRHYLLDLTNYYSTDCFVDEICLGCSTGMYSQALSQSEVIYLGLLNMGLLNSAVFCHK